MANADAARGFWPVKHLTGGLVRTSEYPIASALGENIFSGDAVILVAGGGIEPAAANERVVGIFDGVTYTNAAGEVVFSKYWPSGTVATNIKANVYDDPYIVFGCQSAGSTVAADVGNITDLVAGAGSTSTGVSGFELNGTSGTGTAQFRILGKFEAPNNAYGTNVDLLVQPYEHEFVDHGQSTPGV